MLLLATLAFTAPLKINILYLQEQLPIPPTLSNVIKDPKDGGLMGARLAAQDVQKTAHFFNQDFSLQIFSSTKPQELKTKLSEHLKENTFVLLDTSTDFTSSIAKTHAKKGLFFNVSNEDNLLRTKQCRPNLFHTVASNAMLSDALVQFLVARNWKNWFMITGKNEQDKQFLASILRSQKRFGGKITTQKEWDFNTDLRRVASKEMSLFTQSKKDYDVVLVSDKLGDFGEYIYFNTWLPRPLAGTQGLTPVTWHKVIEQWGAAQLQSRFESFANRWMNDIDYSAWVSIFAISELVKSTKSAAFSENLKAIYQDDFSFGGYKGRKLSFRSFNGQMRQNIALVHSRGLVSISPQEGFLHPASELDTLGFSKQEVNCSP